MITEQGERQAGTFLGVLAAPFIIWPLALVMPHLAAPLVVLACAFLVRIGATGWRRAIASGVVLGALLTLAYYYFVIGGLDRFD